MISLKQPNRISSQGVWINPKLITTIVTANVQMDECFVTLQSGQCFTIKGTQNEIAHLINERLREEFK